MVADRLLLARHATDAMVEIELRDLRPIRVGVYPLDHFPLLSHYAAKALEHGPKLRESGLHLRHLATMRT